MVYLGVGLLLGQIYEGENVMELELVCGFAKPY